MTRYLVWAVNGVLIALCAFWLAGLVNAVIGAWLGAAAPTDAQFAVQPSDARPTWEERRIILDKNLFQVSTLLPTDAPPPESETQVDLDESSLPFRLIGTVASTIPEHARAAVMNEKEGSRMVVRVGDELLGEATVIRIERRRLVIENRGQLEALSLDDDRKERAEAPRSASRTTPRPRPGSRRVPPQPADAPEFLKSEAANATLRDPQQIASQARWIPEHDQNTQKLVGIRVDDVKSGSLLEDIGLRNGDTIVGLNGLGIEGAEDGAALFRELADAQDIEVQVRGSDGGARTLEYSHE